MKISKTHKRFADRLKDQTALEYPERFLGPNWKDVLNFWIYLDTLSDDDLRLIEEQYCALDDSHTIRCRTWKATKDTVGYYCQNAAWGATFTLIGACATYELIGSHKLEALTVLPLFLNHKI